MKLDFEYGNGLMSAELPDNTKVFIPGETVPDPPCLPQDWDSLYAATLESIRNPIGMEPLRELAGPGKTVVFVIPDIINYGKLGGDYEYRKGTARIWGGRDSDSGRSGGSPETSWYVYRKHFGKGTAPSGL